MTAASGSVVQRAQAACELCRCNHSLPLLLFQEHDEDRAGLQDCTMRLQEVGLVGWRLEPIQVLQARHRLHARHLFRRAMCVLPAVIHGTAQLEYARQPGAQQLERLDRQDDIDLARRWSAGPQIDREAVCRHHRIGQAVAGDRRAADGFGEGRRPRGFVLQGCVRLRAEGPQDLPGTAEEVCVPDRSSRECQYLPIGVSFKHTCCSLCIQIVPL